MRHHRPKVSLGLALAVMVVCAAACSTGSVFDIWFNTWQRYPKSVDVETRQALCKAVEGLGYKLPFGAAVGNGYDLWREYVVVKTTERGDQWYATPDYYVFVMALASIDRDHDSATSISVETQDRLTQDARRLCRDVQYEASKLLSGTIHIALMQWDWSNGVRIQYGLTTEAAPAYSYSAVDCNLIVPLVTSVGATMSQETHNEAMCPSYEISP